MFLLSLITSPALFATESNNTDSQTWICGFEVQLSADPDYYYLYGMDAWKGYGPVICHNSKTKAQFFQSLTFIYRSLSKTVIRVPDSNYMVMRGRFILLTKSFPKKIGGEFVIHSIPAPRQVSFEHLPTFQIGCDQSDFFTTNILETSHDESEMDIFFKTGGHLSLVPNESNIPNCHSSKNKPLLPSDSDSLTILPVHEI